MFATNQKQILKSFFNLNNFGRSKENNSENVSLEQKTGENIIREKTYFRSFIHYFVLTLNRPKKKGFYVV